MQATPSLLHRKKIQKKNVGLFLYQENNYDLFLIKLFFSSPNIACISIFYNNIQDMANSVVIKYRIVQPIASLSMQIRI